MKNFNQTKIAENIKALGNVGLNDLPTKKYLIKNFLDSTSLSVVYGESNCGKTFVVINIAAHLAMGRKWLGRKTKKGAVVYIAAEGGQSIIDRLTAAKKQNQLSDDADFFLIPASVDLRGDEDVAVIIEEIARLGIKADMIIIDTLARAIAGGDENSSEDMGAFIKNCDKIREDTGAHVLIVHHCGKDSVRGARGHSSLRGAVDTETEVTRQKESGLIIAEVKKQRDGATGDKFFFRLEPVHVRMDEDGESVTSCVLKPASANEKIIKLRGQTGRALEILKNLIATAGVSYQHNDAQPSVQAIGQDKFRQALQDAGISASDKPGSLQKAIVRVIGNLNNKGITKTYKGFVWIPDNSDNTGQNEVDEFLVPDGQDTTL